MGVSSSFPNRDLCMSYFHYSLEFFPYVEGGFPAGFITPVPVSTKSRFQTPVIKILNRVSFSIAVLTNW